MPESLPMIFPIAYAAPGAYPWSAVVIRHDGSIASGAVVAPQWVLTCAHVGAQQFDQVMIGGCDLSLRDGTFCVVERVVPNPKYNPLLHEADLALLHLYDAPPVTPMPIAAAPPPHLEVAVLVGWGQASVGDPAPGDLRRILLTTASALQVTIWEIVAGFFGKRVFPLTRNDGRVSYGDSGAPVLIGGSAVALMSFQMNEGRDDASVPLPEYLPWIQQTTRDS